MIILFLEWGFWHMDIRFNIERGQAFKLYISLPKCIVWCLPGTRSWYLTSLVPAGIDIKCSFFEASQSIVVSCHIHLPNAYWWAPTGQGFSSFRPKFSVYEGSISMQICLLTSVGYAIVQVRIDDHQIILISNGNSCCQDRDFILKLLCSCTCPECQSIHIDWSSITLKKILY